MTLAITLQIGAGLLALYWFAISYKAVQGWLARQDLPPLLAADAATLADHPVSVVIAARNEEQRVGKTLENLLQQQDIRLEIVVVNDRSTDGTARILDGWARQHQERLRVLHLDQLPPGWLGKCHALARGVELARHPWILFTDADIHMVPNVIARAVAQAVRSEADHLTLFPDLLVLQPATRFAIIGQAMLFTLYTSPERINADKGRMAVGVGAFNLIRRAAYDRIGGHERLKMEVVDDMKLGELIRRHGLRQRVYSGLGEIQADWAQTVPQVIQAMEKNWFAAMDFSLFKSILFFVFVPVTLLGALAGPLYAGLWGWFALAGLASTAIPGMLLAKRFGWSPLLGIFSVFGWMVFVIGGVNSTWKTLRQGGIRWRDHFYPLAELRNGLIRMGGKPNDHLGDPVKVKKEIEA